MLGKKKKSFRFLFEVYVLATEDKPGQLESPLEILITASRETQKNLPAAQIPVGNNYKSAIPFCPCY